MFMSTRVMKIGVGQRYEHHFTDDLESFFWLILWSVIGHVDVEGTHPTGIALRMLNLYSRRDLDFVAIKKELILSACRESGLIIHTLLDACKDGNAWAVHPTVVRLVQKLGLYFNTVYTEGSFAKQTPEVVFPIVVDHIMDTLKSL
ncbi:hypothetical protein FRC12_004882 [Ceratobasidium sp. 428]|nr:hypothetical protein FRC12_004882 [Ceratobasidium sp. 428]